MADIALVVGRVYRGKRIRNCGGLVNDRVIKWMGVDSVQFDSPSVAFGRRYPVVSRSQFLSWAGRDVTDELPAGLWADYPSVKQKKEGI